MITLTRSQSALIGGLVVIVLAIGFVTFYVADRSHLGIKTETKEIFTDTSEEEVTYQDILGNKVSLETYLGRVMVVSSWASWSPFSNTDLQVLNELAKNYDKEEVVFIAMNRKETKEQAVRYLNTQPPLSNLLIVIDTEDKFYERVGGYAMPETIIFDRKGNIVLHERGVVDLEHIESVLADTLGQ
jgi:thiol-disulfide isomerase/thioredoxin